MADIIPSDNPLNKYVDPASMPEMTIDGVVVNKRYAMTGVVNTLPENSIVSYPSPQTGQSNSQKNTNLPNQVISPGQGFTNFKKGKIGNPTIVGVQMQLQLPNTVSTVSATQAQQVVFLNYISFKFWDVPANWTIWYQDPLTGIMQQLTYEDGSYVGGRTTGENPFSWTFQEVYFQTIATSLIEFRFDRKLNPTQFTNPVFNVPYSFGIGQVNFKLIATDDYRQIPATAILATKNSLGVAEQYVKIQRDSSQIQTPSNRTNPARYDSYWKSQPQPVGDAVVCLYADMSKKTVIDSLYLDPLYTGVSMNLYYSNDSTISDMFWCSRAETVFAQKDKDNPIKFLNVGEQLWGPFGNTRSGAVFPKSTVNPNSGLVLPTNIPVDGQQNWAIGLKFTPNDNSTGGTLINQKISSTDSIKLTYAISGSNITFAATINGQIISQTATKISKPSGGWVNAPYCVLFGFDNTSPTSYGNNPPYAFIYASTNNNNPPYAVTATGTTYFTNSITPITLGNSQDGSQTANAIILDFWIRQDSVNQSIFNAYTSHSRPFIDSYGPESSLRGDYKSLILARLNSINCNSGPSAEYYDKKTWTPLQADLILRKGTYSIPLINARYIKMEFTNLKDDVYLPPDNEAITYTTKFFPTEIIGHFKQLENASQNIKKNNYVGLATQAPGGTPNSLEAINNSPFTATGAVANQLPVTQTALNATQNGTTTTPNPNQVASIVDPTIAYSFTGLLDNNQQNVDQSNVLSYMTPRFYEIGVHNYIERQIKQTWKKSYFVGLKALQFFQKAQTTVDDTEYYYDPCFNPPGSITAISNVSIFDSTGETLPFNNVGSNTTIQGYQATAANQIIYTLPLTSFSMLSSFQLAANHSDWKSLIPYSQALFISNNLSYWSLINIETPQPIPSFQLYSGVYQIQPSINNLTYGLQTPLINLPDTSTSTIQGIRLSASARIYLPNTNKGNYTVNLYGNLNGVNTLLGSQTKKLNALTWHDIQVVYSVSNDANSITDLYATLTQDNNLINEIFYVTMFTISYNPISFAWTYDKTNFFQITSTINNPNGFNSLNYPSATIGDTYTFFIRVKAHETGAYFNSILISPDYPYDAYTPNALIDYYPDAKTNELTSKVPPVNQPMFQLPSDYFPVNFSLQNTQISGV